MTAKKKISKSQVQRFLQKLASAIKNLKLSEVEFELLLTGDLSLKYEVLRKIPPIIESMVGYRVEYHIPFRAMLSVSYRFKLEKVLLKLVQKLQGGNASIGGILRGSAAKRVPLDVNLIPDSGNGVVQYEVMEFWPHDRRTYDLDMVDYYRKLRYAPQKYGFDAKRTRLKHEVNWEFADVRTTLAYIAKHSGRCWDDKHHRVINTLFMVGNITYRLSYGRVADPMNMRMEGPIFEIKEIPNLEKEAVYHFDRFLLVRK